MQWRAIGDGDDERGKQLREWRRVGVWCAVFGGFELMWMFVVSALLKVQLPFRIHRHGWTWRLATFEAARWKSKYEGTALLLDQAGRIEVLS